MARHSPWTAAPAEASFSCSTPFGPEVGEASSRSRIVQRIRVTTAAYEVDCGLLDAVEVGPNLRVGLQVSLYLRTHFVPGLASEGCEEVVHGGMSEQIG